MRIRITSVDNAPDELYEQTPFEAALLREVPGPDRPDYWLAELSRPLLWRRGAAETPVNYLVLAARWQGTKIGAGMRGLPVGIAYVVDESVLADAELDFAKCVYVAVGAADEITGDA